MLIGCGFRLKRSPVAPVTRRKSFRGTGAGPETAPTLVVRPTRGSRWTKIRRAERAGLSVATLFTGLMAVAIAGLVFFGALVAAGHVRIG